MNKAIIGGTISNMYFKDNRNQGKKSFANIGIMTEHEGYKAYVSVKAFDEYAIMINNGYTKGSRIEVECNVKSGSYEDRHGNKIYNTDLFVYNVLSDTAQHNNYQGQQQNNYQGQGNYQQPNNRQNNYNNQNGNQNNNRGNNQYNNQDDIPF